MAINAALSDFTPAQRKVTYVPLPFQEMYGAMMEKQKRYDQADMYERQSKREISTLSSPIAGHNEYLNKNIKDPFMQKVMALHSSMPDKGSSDYQRKLNEIVDATISDSNFASIQQSSAEYEKFVKVSAEQMAKGMYSNAAAKPYKDFTGLNPDGTIAKFQFMGLRSKKDVDGIIAETVAKIPTTKVTRDNTTIGGRRIAIGTEVKSPSTIYSALSNRIYNDPDLLADAMEQFNAKDVNELGKILKIKANNEAINNSEVVTSFDAGLMRLAEEKKAAKAVEQQQPQVSSHIGDYPDDYNNSVLKEVENYLDANGNVKPATIEKPSWGSTYGGSGERAGAAGSALAGEDMNKRRREHYLTSTASLKEREAYSKKKLLENPKFKAIVDNYMHAGLKQDEAIKMAGKELKKMPHSQKRYEGRYIIDKNEHEVLNRTLRGLGEGLSFYDYLNPISKGKVPFADVLKQSEQEDLSNLDIGAELAPIAGLEGNQNYQVTLGKRTWVVSMDSPYPDRVQSKALFDAERTRSPLKLRKYDPTMDNNMEHDALRKDAATYGTNNVIVYTGTDGKLHLKREK